ncbi:hypothetical protein CTI12_AA119990 [Artemisia annua]|uniref:Uncharacterized protein n=1 Tax=Artemisia annua TaxID=35608 RepID=A0A2U1PRQ3_ARTAN|nr:hypothetical protein CTI12_AA119990 [Artemisia annua]
MGILSKAARDRKLDKELEICLDVFLYLLEFKSNDVLRAASDNIKDVMKELRESKSGDDKDLSSIIKECRSKVVNQLQYICDNNVSYKEAFVHFKSKIEEAHLTADNDDDTTAKVVGASKKKKGKASQLTKLELQQQRDDEKKLNVCWEKQEVVKQLTWDYQITVDFIQSFVIGKEAAATHKDTILIDAFRNISNGYRDLYNFYGYDEDDKWYHLDVSRMIKEYKSKVEKELLQVCNKVSHPTIKEAFTRHLADVKAGTIPAQNHRPHLHNKDEKRMSTKQKTSVIKKKKRSRLLMRRRELTFVKHKPPLFLEHHSHRHSQCCFRNTYFDRMYGHFRKSPPKEGEDDIDDV